MKIRYTFRVEGAFRLNGARDIAFGGEGGATVTPKLSADKVLEGLVVTYPVAPPYDLPKLRPSTEPGISIDVEIPSTPHRESAETCARNVEAYLSPLGVDSIDVENPGFEWVPESEEERQSLSLFSIGSEPGVPDRIYALWRHAVLRAAVRAKAPNDDFRIQLGFFRAGWAQVRRFRYVEAYLLFFFFVEGLFGQSQIKSKPLEASFLGAPELIKAIEITISKRPPSSKADHWRNLSADQAIGKLIALRGFISHNPNKRANNWNPDDQSVHAIDAMFLANVATKIVIRRLWGEKEEAMPAFPVIFDEDRSAFDRFLYMEQADEGKA